LTRRELARDDRVFSHTKPPQESVVGHIGKRVAPLVATLAMTATAMAQVPEEQGFFGNIDGRWMWLGGDRIVTSQGAASRTTSGPGGQMLIGYKISNDWDFALAGDVQGLLTELTKLHNGTLSVDANHQHFDLEAGYTHDWWRINAGLRGIHYHQWDTYNIPAFTGYDQRDMYGIGPKVGAGARWAVSDSWAVVGGADVALHYTSFVDYGTGVLTNNGTYWRLVPQLSSELGLSWRSADTPSLSFTVGARVAASFNTAITADGSHVGTLLEFGPFIRMAYNFAGPGRHPPVQAPATGTPPEKRQGYQLFFGFDRADISPVADGVIRQAADDTRRGRPANIQLHGAASCSEELSLRRAGAVRDELVKYGVSAEQISIAPRGESDPLVPTADGIEEARNRRILIAF
jgi:hypothetical protein